MNETEIYDRPAVHPAFGADVHVGRSWKGTHLEDDCPCDKAPCGLVIWSRIQRDCGQHALRFMKTLRQIHSGDECVGVEK